MTTTNHISTARMSIHTLILICLVSSTNGLKLSPEYKNVYFGTKTAYKKVININGKKADIYIPHDHTAEMVYLLSRHGARYPGGGTIKRIEKLKNFLTNINHPLAKLLHPNQYMIHGLYNELASNGFRGQFGFGKNIGRKFSKYLLQSINNGNGNINNRLHFKSTCKRRTIDSMEAFKNGFFHNLLGKEFVAAKNCSDGIDLRFYDYCYKYKQNKQKLHSTLQQFYNTKLFQQMLHRLTTKLINHGATHMNTTTISLLHLKITFDHIRTLYTVCSFRVLLFDVSIEHDPFCGLFNSIDLSLWEYYNDVADNYKIGHAYKSTAMMSTPLFQHIYNLLRKSVESDRVDNFNLYAEFAHAETLLPLLELLSVIPSYINQTKNDNHNYIDLPMNIKEMENLLEFPRVRRYGKISPMNANIIFVVLRNKHDNKKGIAIYVNERLTPIECCVRENNLNYNRLICPWKMFRSCFEHLSRANKLFDDNCRAH